MSKAATIPVQSLPLSAAVPYTPYHGLTILHGVHKTRFPVGTYGLLYHPQRPAFSGGRRTMSQGYPVREGIRRWSTSTGMCSPSSEMAISPIRGPPFLTASAQLTGVTASRRCERSQAMRNVSYARFVLYESSCICSPLG